MQEDKTSPAAGPLHGVRVLDLSAYIAGPYGCALLADQGADVIKIEPPVGDNLRKYPSTLADESRAFVGVNRSKRGLVLDLKNAADLQVLIDLVRGADVLVHNFRPSVPPRLGIDYASLAAVNPRLVYCAVTGYGETGPLREKAGYDQVLQTMTGMCTMQAPAGEAPAGAPQAYVRGLFDSYADDFEPHLLNVLRYRAHEAAAQAAAAALAGTPVDAALDLGCGTGLCGPLLRPLARRLHGLDLSPTMLEQARARGCYDQLVQADLTAYLQQTPERYGLVAAADVFIYVGALEPVFAGVRRVLQPGGVFAFSVESSDGQALQLRPSLRYAHGADHLRALAAQHGLEIVQAQPLVLREDQRQPIQGQVLCLRAPGGAATG